MSKKFKTPTIEQLLDAGVHFGHQVRRWNPKMAPYIFAQRMGIHVIDLEQTEKLLKEACDFLYEVASKGGQVIFIGTKRQAKDIITIEAKRAGALYVNERWIGGTLTNFAVIKKNIDKLLNFLKRKEKGELSMYTKRERLLIDREIEDLQRKIGGIVGLTGKPAAVFVVDARREKTAIREANRAGVPVVSLLDTNSDPSGIAHLVPGNDDAIRSVALIIGALADAVEAGYKEFADKSKNGAVAPVVVEKSEEVVVDEAPLVVSSDEAPHLEEETDVKKILKEVEEAPAEVEDVDAKEVAKEPEKKEVKKETKKVAKKSTPKKGSKK